MTDPYAHGTPAGDDHTWVRPTGAPCPHCHCCSAVLCQTAIGKGTACHWEGDGADYDLALCPCWRTNSAARNPEGVTP